LGVNPNWQQHVKKRNLSLKYCIKNGHSWATILMVTKLVFLVVYLVYLVPKEYMLRIEVKQDRTNIRVYRVADVN
jgi:hypothetical protein